MIEDNQDVSAYDRDDLMNEKYDSSDLAIEADNKIRPSKLMQLEKQEFSII